MESTTTFNEKQFILSQTENLGPTIQWGGPENSTENMTIMWDGAYTGQTEENWNLDCWVNDSDRVDSVIFLFKKFHDSEWTNITPTLVEGNTTLGRYYFNYTYSVSWNETSQYPHVEEGGGNFAYRIYANDTLGHWTITGTLTFNGGYMVVFPPTTTTVVDSISYLVPTIVSASIVMVAIVVAILAQKRK